MPDPRSTVDMEGIGRLPVTYDIDDSTITFDDTQANGSAQVGLAVTLSAAKTVALAADGDPIEGELEEVFADNTCRVNTAGYMTLPGGDGAALTLGQPIVGDLDASANPGYIRAAAPATTPTAAEVDDARNGRGSIQDASTPAETLVRLP